MTQPTEFMKQHAQFLLKHSNKVGDVINKAYKDAKCASEMLTLILVICSKLSEIYIELSDEFEGKEKMITIDPGVRKLMEELVSFTPVKGDKK